MSKEKIFRDPIYGYISIPVQYCENFIGVYYLGQLAFSYLRKNSECFFKCIKDADWERYKNTFEIACLMHDCGHSPFSHTFEHYYLNQKEEEIKKRLSSFYKENSCFSTEYVKASPAAHEKISALLLLTQFYDKIKNMNASPELAARMIMGLKHEYKLTNIKKFENGLISLLNGSGIDVDSLDYIQRDSWVSGVSNVNIDYQRLLSAIMIKPNKDNINIVFLKKILSVIDNISIGRNFLYKWIYSHHKVIYEQYLLSAIIEEINQKQDGFCKEVFSLETFTRAKEFNNHKYYLPTDDDIIYTIKQFAEDNSKIKEFLSRNYHYKALWKTYFEFNNAHFKTVSDKNRMSIAQKIKKGALEEKYGKGNILYLDVQPKLKGINKNDFFVEIDNELVDAAEATQQKNENLTYFIVYVTEKLRPKKNKIIKDILSLQS